MAPPPVKPSPHRFLTNPNPRTVSKPPSSLRVQQRGSEAPSTQFASTPRFAIPATKRDEEVAPATASSALVSRIRPRSTRAREDIDDNAEEGADDQDADVALATSAHHADADADADTESPLHPRAPKRLRPTVSPPSHGTRAPSTPRFLLTHTAPPPPSRPSFLLPASPAIPCLQTPALLSPHRRGQKFVPGGLAATVRDWVVETSQTALPAATGKRDDEGERVRVGDVRGGARMWLVRPMGGEGRGWVLIGNGERRGEVGVGRVVGVRGPVWEVRVAGAVWRVGVEWRALAGGGLGREGTR